jgi:hypothetical protein
MTGVEAPCYDGRGQRPAMTGGGHIAMTGVVSALQ